MWLIAATTREQKGAISEYFNNPSMMDGLRHRAEPRHERAGAERAPAWSSWAAAWS